MAAGVQTRIWLGPSRRRVPRFMLQAPLDVTVLRSGIPDTVPGRSLNLCERGVAAVFAGELVPGESVGLEVRLPTASDSLRARAMVRYQDKLRAGLEFIGLTPEQRAAIRDWAKGAKAEAEIAAILAEVREKVESESKSGGGTPRPEPPPEKKRHGGRWIALLAIVAIAAAALWWRWSKGWEELESGLKSPDTAAVQEKPQAQVSAEVMQKLLLHRVEAVYPAEARQQKLEGTIALDIVVGRDGSVISMRALNGPDVLARAAMDALRWWKFEPYRLNGEPAVVETTVAVEFKR